MNFTREPLVETVITAKDGHKLALRNSKGGGVEEYFVDAIEVVTFGNSCFYRSLEKPKSFLLPITDYEIIEVREARMVLKSTGVEKGGIKIAGGKTKKAKEEPTEEAIVDEPKVEKRRERRKTRKRRTKEETTEEQQPEGEVPPAEKVQRVGEKPSLIPPPSTLISESIDRYKEIVIHETEGEELPKKDKEFSEGPSENSSEKKAQQISSENDES